MRMRFDISRFVALSCAVTWCTSLCAAPLSAQTVSDPVFGLSVTPPSGYAAMLLTPMPSRNAIIVVQRRDPNDAGCYIEFEVGDAGSERTQSALNARAADNGWIEKVRLEVAARYDIHTIEAIELSGVRGTAITGDRQYNIPVSATRTRKYTREWYVILDTAKGRTTVECTAPRLEFEALQPEFEAILRTISLPK